MSALGCANEYQASIGRRGGLRTVADLAPVQSVRWERVLSATAEAQVVVAKQGMGGECCKALGDMSPWAYELNVYRDGTLVWQGPVVSSIETEETMLVAGQDMTAWWAKWLYQGQREHIGPGDAVTLAKSVIDEVISRISYRGLQLGGIDLEPNMAAYLQYVTGALSTEMDLARTSTLLEIINDLADQGLDYTTMGRRIIVFPDAHEFGGPVAQLSSDDLAGGLQVVTGSDSFATSVLGTSSLDTVAPVVVDVPGTNGPAFYGQVEALFSAGDLSPTSLLWATRARLYRGYPAPVTVGIADDTALLPQAPISVADLVCGSRIDVGLTGNWCQSMVSPLRLAKVTGTWGADAGERIAVSMTTQGEQLLD